MPQDIRTRPSAPAAGPLPKPPVAVAKHLDAPGELFGEPSAPSPAKSMPKPRMQAAPAGIQRPPLQPTSLAAPGTPVVGPASAPATPVSPRTPIPLRMQPMQEVTTPKRKMPLPLLPKKEAAAPMLPPRPLTPTQVPPNEIAPRPAAPTVFPEPNPGRSRMFLHAGLIALIAVLVVGIGYAVYRTLTKPTTNTPTTNTTTDTDGDGLTDNQERTTYKTDPQSTDTDADGVNDKAEITNGTDPLVPEADSDVDADGLVYSDEIKYGTDAHKPDSDGDGYADGTEVDNGYNPNGDGKLTTP